MGGGGGEERDCNNAPPPRSPPTSPPPRSPPTSPPPRQKRPFCKRCNKAARLCLCSRLPSPPLDNPLAVTILQHRREASHPLNSARVASLGFRNVSLFPVSDVNFYAFFLLSPLLPVHLQQQRQQHNSPPPLFDDSPLSVELQSLEEQWIADNQVKGNYKKAGEKCLIRCGSNHLSILIERGTKPDISSILGSPIAESILKHGFTVKKWHRKQLPGSLEFSDFEEFDIVVPRGSILLFPGKRSTTPEEVDFEVKHIFVLDGTWAKARRICYENPWLQFLPRLRLETDQKSLYSEVRQQPSDGYLSTIESIITAMKVLGFDIDGLDTLLDAFGSMISDQRRCKDDKFSLLPQS